MSANSSFYHDKYVHGQVLPSTNLLEFLHRRLQRWEYHRVPATIDLLRPAKRILDVGVGDGVLLKEAIKKGFTEVYGVDISEPVLKTARKNLKSVAVKVSLTKDDIGEGLKYKASFFDAVTMIAVLEHMFDVHQVLREIHRVLKVGGECVIEVPNVCFLPRRLSFLLGILPKTSDEALYTDGHLQFFTYHSLARLMKEHGFMVTYAGCTGIFSRWRNILPTVLGANIMMRGTKL